MEFHKNQHRSTYYAMHKVFFPPTENSRKNWIFKLEVRNGIPTKKVRLKNEQARNNGKEEDMKQKILHQSKKYSIYNAED